MFVGVLGTIGILNVERISQFISSHGLDIPEVLLVLGMVPILWLSTLTSTVVLLLIKNGDSHRD